MKHNNNLAIITIIIACVILAQCGEYKKQGLLSGALDLTKNQAPAARAGADRNVCLYTGSADLDGSASFDPEGKDLAFAWEIVHQPAGSAASFSDSSTATTTLTFDTVGTYEIMLTVSDGSAHRVGPGNRVRGR